MSPLQVDMEQPPAYSPQAVADILPIYRPQDTDGHIRVYKLRRVAPDGQSLALLDDISTVYNVKVRATGGFMNRKPHVVISDIDKTQVIAEGRFDNLGTGTILTFINPPRILTLDLESSQVQRLKTTIGGQHHWWQPHAGNRGVLELTNETEEIVARFIHAAHVPARTEPVGSTKGMPTEMDVGELSVVETLAGTDRGLQEILCSAVVVIERARRRAANMAMCDKQGTGWLAGGFY